MARLQSLNRQGVDSERVYKSLSEDSFSSNDFGSLRAQIESACYWSANQKYDFVLSQSCNLVRSSFLHRTMI